MDIVVFIMRTLEYTVLPPERNLYRLKPAPITHSSCSNTLDPPTTAAYHLTPALLPEPLPPPWTLAKACWSLSLFSSWRGIGWNFASPISRAADRPPFTRSSTRKSFIIYWLKVYPWTFFVHDLTRTYMSLIRSDFFMGTTRYTEMNLMGQVGCSLAVIGRVWYVLYAGYIPAAILAVMVGGWMGWKGEFWEPWSWPPIFGDIAEVWRYPGLSTLWSRVGCCHHSDWMGD